MIYLDSILKAISKKMREGLTYPIKEVDLQKEIPRPCTVVECDNIKNTMATSIYQDEKARITVYIFAEQTHRGYISLLNEQKKIKELLSQSLEIERGFFIYPNDLEFDIDRKDMVLICMFDMLTRQESEDNTVYEPIEELELTFKE